MIIVNFFRHENFFEEDFINLESEVAFLQEKIKTLDSPIVFSHNDLQENNILNNPETHELHFIDFEYANFNYRGFDLGNHFCEWTIEYNDKYDSGFQVSYFLFSFSLSLKPSSSISRFPLLTVYRLP